MSSLAFRKIQSVEHRLGSFSGEYRDIGASSSMQEIVDRQVAIIVARLGIKRSFVELQKRRKIFS